MGVANLSTEDNITKVFNKAVEKYDHFMWEENRRATYKNWVFKDNCKCNAKKMAEAGFIFTGTSREPDAVACFYCDKNLDGWESSDDPWKEHLQHAPYCEFAKLQQSQKHITIRQHQELINMFLQNLTTKIVEGVKSDAEEIFTKALGV